MQPGFSPNFMQILKRKVETLREQDKLCSIVFDEMVIKSELCYDQRHDCIEGVENMGHLGRTKHVASSALVFMARGISSPWKLIPRAWYGMQHGMVCIMALID